MEEYTLAVLSWGAHKTLRNTLESYERSGLLGFAAERLIYFQEESPEDLRLAARYGFESEGNSRNIGISSGYLNLLERANMKNFLFLENDWVCIEPYMKATARIHGSLKLLENTPVKLVRLRHRTSPGHPLWTRQFAGNEYVRPTHLLDCVHWEDRPEKFPEIQKKGSYYITTSRNANWTNNPHLANTEWLRENVKPRLNPMNDIEKDIQGWWENQDFVIAQGEGLFTHGRID